jgi:hypothetical protein
MVLSRVLAGAACVAAAAVLGAPGLAAAQPVPPTPTPAPNPPPPDINAFPPASPQNFAVLNGAAYAFSAGGLTCMLQRSGGYGCNGPLPGAPDGANLVSGGAGGVPAFSVAPAPIYGGPVKPLPAGTRLSFGTVSCGNDGTVTACVDSRNQSGFVVGPSASWIVNEVNPLLVRPDGTNPYFN